MNKAKLRLFAALAASASSLGTAHAATKTIVLKEELNQKWSQELVGYPLEFGPGKCTADSIAATGPNGPLAVQLTDVEYFTDTKFVKSGRLMFVATDLAPRTANTYTVTYGTQPTAPVASDLKITPGDGWVEVDTGHLGVRLLTGSKTYDVPAAAAQVPGPLQSISMGDGKWMGGSHLYGDIAVKSYEATLTDSGAIAAIVHYRYTLADGNVVTFKAQLAAGDSAVSWEMDSTKDDPTTGINFGWGQFPGVKQIAEPLQWGQWGHDHIVPLTPGDKPFAGLSPDTSIAAFWADGPSTMLMASAGGPTLRLASRDPGRWADPIPMTYGGYKTWNLDMIPMAWQNWQRKRTPVSYTADGTISMAVSFAKGERVWDVGNGATALGHRLDTVKDYVLEWPEPANDQHPHLFMSKAEEEAAWKNQTVDATTLGRLIGNSNYPGWAAEAYLYGGGSHDMAAKTKVAETLRDKLQALGNYDTMRQGHAVVGLYDALIDTDLVPAADRPLFRAQLAYLAYRSADPAMWSIERGYHSGNPNMSVSYGVMEGLIACEIPNHPMAKTWSDHTTAWVDKWLTDEVGANGEWKVEGAHYSQVSITPIVAYAIAAKRAGFHDFTTDPRLKKMVLYYAKVWTPADPQRNNLRVSPAFGRGTSGDSTGIFGVMAKATQTSDPEYSAVMQWMWQQSGYELQFGDWRLGGFEPIYTDRSLPAKKPDWSSESFPSMLAVLRDGVGDPNENYLNIVATDDSKQNLDIWVPEVGGVAAWFAYGRQVSKAFAWDVGYNERHELLRDGVFLARNWGAPNDSKSPFGYYTTTSPEAAVFAPRADYLRDTYHNTEADNRDWFEANIPAFPRVTAATKPTLDWTRQTLYMKDDTPSGPHYLLLRDTTGGGQPTEWQFRTLSEKIGTPDQTRDMTAFLADKPGYKIVPARQLPGGDRYTAIGQFGVDLDYFVASPSDTPRYTTRYGGSRDGVPEFEDLFQLQLPGDGSYFVAVFPRKAADVSPVFSTLAGGKVIKVTGAFGTDYGFLSHDVVDAPAGDAMFHGTAGAVQDRTSGLVLSLAAPGTVSYHGYAVSAAAPISLRAATKTLTLTLPSDSAGGEFTVTAPGKWSLPDGQHGVKLAKGKGGYVVTIADGTQIVELQKG